MSNEREVMNVSEVRNGVVRLFQMYPDLYKEYKSGGIFLEFSETNGCYLSRGKCRVDSLPDVFSDCKGEKGKGKISLDNIVEYDEEVLSTIATYRKMYSEATKGCSYCIWLDANIDFNLRDFVPLAKARSWSSPAELPDRVIKFIENLYGEDLLSVVSKLHMVDGYPVISTSSKQNGSSDYGFAELLLKWVKNTPIKEVYIICNGWVSRYVMKKHSDGEYTISIF